MAKKSKPTDEQLRSLEETSQQAQNALRDAIKRRFPDGSSVLVQIRTNQKRLSPATVVSWSVRQGHVRVRQMTARGQVIDVHWTKAFPE